MIRDPEISRVLEWIKERIICVEAWEVVGGHTVYIIIGHIGDYCLNQCRSHRKDFMSLACGI